MAILIFGVWLHPTPPPPPPPPPFPHNLNLPQSNAMDDNNNNFLDNNLLLNQESVHAQEQEQEHDPWSIKKTLTKSDVNDLCRLMLKSAEVQKHVLSKWKEEQGRAFMKTEQGVRVDVLDVDTETVHQVVFKRWKSSGSFVFTNNWVAKFVKRRALKQGDKIGLRWDSECSRFCFCVLS